MADDNKPQNTTSSQEASFGPQPYTFGTDPEADKRNGFATEDNNTAPIPMREDVTTNAESIKVDNTDSAPQKPQTWQEAVKAHFTPKEKPWPKFGNNQAVIDFLQRKMDEYTPLTQEQIEKLRKKQKAEKIVSSIADAARAVSNLWGTSQYAPNMYNAADSMTARAQARFDKEKAERDAEDDRFLNYALMMGKLKDEYEETEYQRGRDAIADHYKEVQEARAQAKFEYDEKMQELKLDYMQGRIDKQAYDEERAKNKEEYEKAYWDARTNELNSRTRKNDRWQPSQGRGGGRSGNSKPAEHVWVDKDGNLHYAHTENAARSQAGALGGEYKTTPKITTKEYTDGLGQKHTSTTTSYSNKATNKKMPGVKMPGVK